MIVVNGEPKASLGGSQAARDILSNPFDGEGGVVGLLSAGEIRELGGVKSVPPEA